MTNLSKDNKFPILKYAPYDKYIDGELPLANMKLAKDLKNDFLSTCELSYLLGYDITSGQIDANGETIVYVTHYQVKHNNLKKILCHYYTSVEESYITLELDICSSYSYNHYSVFNHV